MKKSIVIILLAIATIAQAQRYTDIVKVQPLSLIGNSFTAEWEHIENHNAITVTIGLPVNGPSKKDWFNAPSDLHTYNVRAGYRHYTTDKRRLYFEPYLKCQTIDWRSVLKQGFTDGYLFTTNAGVSLGYQITWKQLVIDLYPLGVEVGRLNGGLDSYSKTEADARYMTQYIADLSGKLPRNSTVHIYQDGKNVNAVLDLKTYYWLRSGFSIGYRFQRK